MRMQCMPTTIKEAPVKRIKLRSIQPGQRLLAIEACRLVGPRGGRYQYRGMHPRNGTPMEFTHSTLSPDGKERTFHFKGAHPHTINDHLSCVLVAQVEGVA